MGCCPASPLLEAVTASVAASCDRCIASRNNMSAHFSGCTRLLVISRMNALMLEMSSVTGRVCPPTQRSAASSNAAAQPPEASHAATTAALLRSSTEHSAIAPSALRRRCMSILILELVLASAAVVEGWLSLLDAVGAAAAAAAVKVCLMI